MKISKEEFIKIIEEEYEDFLAEQDVKSVEPRRDGTPTPDLAPIDVKGAGQRTIGGLKDSIRQMVPDFSTNDIEDFERLLGNLEANMSTIQTYLETLKNHNVETLEKEEEES